MIISGGIHHISFDLWMTLIASDPEFKPKRDALLASRFGLTQPMSEVTATLRNFDRLCDHISVMCGQTAHYESLLILVLNALDKNAEELTTAQLSAFYAEMEALFFEHPPRLLNNDTLEVFEELRSNDISISLLSNTGFIKGRTLRKRLDQLGIAEFMNFQLYSDEHGAAKPSSDFFECAYNTIRTTKTLTKEQILHTGDNPIADVKGALDFGFRSILYDKEVPSLRILLQL